MGRLLLVGMGLAAGLVLAEMGLRLQTATGAEYVAQAVVADYPGHLFALDRGTMVLNPLSSGEFATTEYRVTVQTNSLGLRGPELAEPQRGEIKVLVVGDSFTLGAQVEEEQTFVSLLAPDLTERLGRPVVTLNGGVDGHGTADSMKILKRVRGKARPDLVVLAFYLGNDLRDNSRSKEEPEEPEVAHVGALQAKLQQGLVGMAKYSFVVNRIAAWRLTQRGPEDPVVAAHAAELQVYVDPELRQRQLAHTRTALRDFGRACKTARLGCAVALIPPAYAVHDERLDGTFEAFGFDPEQVDTEALVEGVREAAQPLPVIDLSTALRSAATHGPLYYTYDAHWNAAGHAAAAEALSEGLADTLGSRR